MEKYLEGSQTPPFTVHVTRDMIRRYARSIKAVAPVYLNVKEARATGYTDLLAPPTLPIIFWQYAEVRWLNEFPPLLHGEQSFDYHQPIIAGQTFKCHIQLTKTYEKNGARGPMLFLKHELLGHLIAGSPLNASPTFKAVSTLIHLKEDENV